MYEIESLRNGSTDPHEMCNLVYVWESDSICFSYSFFYCLALICITSQRYLVQLVYYRYVNVCYLIVLVPERVIRVEVAEWVGVVVACVQPRLADGRAVLAAVRHLHYLQAGAV